MVFLKRIREIIILVGISVILAMVVNFLSPKGIALVGQWDTSRGVISAGVNGPEEWEPQKINSVARAKAIFDTGSVLFVDARSQEDYEDGHIPGAVSLPVGQFDQRIEAFLDQNPPDTRIVTYCSGRTCEDSHHLAQLLINVGFSQVSVFIDGFPGWEAQGFPIE